MTVVKQGWRSKLLYKTTAKSRTLRAISANVITILANDDAWRGVLAYDEFGEVVVTVKPPPWRPDDAPAKVTPGEWSDEDTVRVQAWIADAYGIDVGIDGTLNAVRIAAHRNRVHPVRDWLHSLRWDGKQRCPTWLSDVMGCPDTPYVRAVGTAFLVAAVARVMAPGCKVDTVPILEGEQGIFKSSVLRALAGDDWFLEMSASDLANKDAMQILRRKWIVEMPEIDGLSKSETAHVKSYFSRQVDTYRPSYGRGSRDFLRQCVFVGTTNASQYLKDETGGRRFWPIVCARGDVRLARAIRDQLWAEARARYESSEAWHITDPALADEFAVQQDARYSADPWETSIAAWLIRPTEVGRPRAELGVTTADVLEHAVKVELGRRTKADAMRVAACLRRLGWHPGNPEKKEGARVRLYRPSASSAAVAGPPDIEPLIPVDDGEWPDDDAVSSLAFIEK